MEGFQVTEIGEKIYCILDAGNSSFYVVEGEEKAAVIDTGITAGAKILPVIRELTDKPLLLVITHAHPDHMYHIDEFDEVYMCHEEKKMDPEMLVMLTAGKLKPWEEIHDIRTDSVISLGGTELAVCQTPGHTPGSVVVLETKQNYLFTGDAIGSGCGVWMQVPGGATTASICRRWAGNWAQTGYRSWDTARAMINTPFMRPTPMATARGQPNICSATA